MIDRSRGAMRRRIEELNARHCQTAAELGKTLNELVRLENKVWREAVVIALLECFANLVRRTPVDTGRLRAGWRISDYDSSFAPAAGNYAQYQGHVAAAIDKAIDCQNEMTSADVLWIYNNVEYVLALNAGWSKRQAGGFIDLFLQELKGQLEKLAQASR